MEPLSIGVSVVGILTAAAQVSKLLTTLVHSGKNAPSLAKSVLREVSDIDAVLTQLRGFLDGSGTGSQPRKELVMMDQVVVTLAHASISTSIRSSSVFEIESIRHRVTDTAKTPLTSSTRMSEIAKESDYVIYTA